MTLFKLYESRFHIEISLIETLADFYSENKQVQVLLQEAVVI